jgi:hypothetical protein
VQPYIHNDVHVDFSPLPNSPFQLFVRWSFRVHRFKRTRELGYQPYASHSGLNPYYHQCQFVAYE